MNIALREVAFAVLGLGLFACTAGGTTVAGDNPPPSDLGRPSPSAQPTSTGTPSPAPTQPQRAKIRFANAAYQTGAVDFCVKKEGATSWEGPLLAKLGVTDGADEGVMTNAFDREVGAWEVGAVTAKTSTCDKPFATSKAAIELPGNGSALVILIGNGGVTGREGNAIVGLVDESTAPASGKARVRFLHASPNWLSGKASVYLDGAAPTFEGVGFGELAKSSSAGAISAAGYVDVASPQQVVVRGLEDFDGEHEIYGTFTASSGSSVTMILEGAAGSGFSPPTVLTCPDDFMAATTNAPFVTCRN